MLRKVHRLWILVDMSQQPVQGIPQWTLGDRLSKSLSHAGMSVGSMADYLGISRNTVGNYINDRTGIPRPTLILWAMKVGLPVEWLESGDAPTGPPDGPGGGIEDSPAMQALARQKRSRARAGTTHQYLVDSAAA